MPLNREMGFSMGWGGEDDEDEEGIEAELLNKVRFLEFWFRERHPHQSATLREKFFTLASGLPPEALTFLSDSFPDLVQRIIVTRNFLTHLDPALQGKAEKGDGLKAISLKFGYFLSFTFLFDEYGIEGIKKLCTRPPKNERLRDLLNSTDQPPGKDQLKLF